MEGGLPIALDERALCQVVPRQYVGAFESANPNPVSLTAIGAKGEKQTWLAMLDREKARHPPGESCATWILPAFFCLI